MTSMHHHVCVLDGGAYRLPGLPCRLLGLPCLLLGLPCRLLVIVAVLLLLSSTPTTEAVADDKASTLLEGATVALGSRASLSPLHTNSRPSIYQHRKIPDALKLHKMLDHSLFTEYPSQLCTSEGMQASTLQNYI